MNERTRFAVCAALSLYFASSVSAIAQDAQDGDSDEPEMEEIVVTGSHIRGANITGAFDLTLPSRPTTSRRCFSRAKPSNVPESNPS